MVEYKKLSDLLIQEVKYANEVSRIDKEIQ